MYNASSPTTISRREELKYAFNTTAEDSVNVTAHSVGPLVGYLYRVSEYVGFGLGAEFGYTSGFRFDGYSVDDLFGNGATMNGITFLVGPTVQGRLKVGNDDLVIVPLLSAGFSSRSHLLLTCHGRNFVPH